MRRKFNLGYYIEVTVKIDVDGDRFKTEKFKTSVLADYDDAIEEAERYVTGEKKPPFGHSKVWDVAIVERTIVDKRMRMYI